MATQEQHREYERRYRERHAEKLRIRGREWARANRSVGRDWTLRTKFGITLEDYDALLQAQGGGCAVCGKTPEQEGRSLAVDHDHETGDVRGILCTSCNTSIGVIEKDPARFQRILEYLGMDLPLLTKACYDCGATFRGSLLRPWASGNAMTPGALFTTKLP